MTWHGDAGLFVIKARNFNGASDAILKKRPALGSRGNDLKLLLSKAGLSVSISQSSGDITHMWVDGADEHSIIDDVMSALGPFVEAGHSIRLYSEESDSYWLGVCYRFDGKKVASCDLISVPMEDDNLGKARLLAIMAAELVRDGMSSEKIMETIQRAIVEDVMDR